MFSCVRVPVVSIFFCYFSSQTWLKKKSLMQNLHLYSKLNLYFAINLAKPFLKGTSSQIDSDVFKIF